MCVCACENMCVSLKEKCCEEFHWRKVQWSSRKKLCQRDTWRQDQQGWKGFSEGVVKIKFVEVTGRCGIAYRGRNVTHGRWICAYSYQLVFSLAELWELALNKLSKCRGQAPVYREEIYKRRLPVLWGDGCLEIHTGHVPKSGQGMSTKSGQRLVTIYSTSISFCKHCCGKDSLDKSHQLQLFITGILDNSFRLVLESNP